MKRIEKPLHKKIGTVTLYYEELFEIYTILASYSDKVIIRNDDYIYDNFNDLIDTSPKNKLLTFYIENPEASIEMEVRFGHDDVVITSNRSSSMECSHIFSQIVSVIEPTSNKFINVTSQGYFRLFFTIAFGALGMRIAWASGAKNNTWMVIPAFVLLLLPVLSLYVSVENDIYFSKRKDTKSIFNRTKDDIFSNVMASLVTGVGGFLLGLLVNWFK